MSVTSSAPLSFPFMPFPFIEFVSSCEGTNLLLRLLLFASLSKLKPGTRSRRRSKCNENLKKNRRSNMFTRRTGVFPCLFFFIYFCCTFIFKYYLFIIWTKIKKKIFLLLILTKTDWKKYRWGIYYIYSI
jgi:hypothetical protein